MRSTQTAAPGNLPPPESAALEASAALFERIARRVESEGGWIGFDAYMAERGWGDSDFDIERVSDALRSIAELIAANPRIPAVMRAAPAPIVLKAEVSFAAETSAAPAVSANPV